MSNLKKGFQQTSGDNETEVPDILVQFQTLDSKRSQRPGYSNISDIPNDHYPTAIRISGNPGWISEDKISAMEKDDPELNTLFKNGVICKDKATLVLSYEGLYPDGDTQDPAPYPDFSSPKDTKRGLNNITRLLALTLKHGIIDHAEAAYCGYKKQQTPDTQNNTAAPR
jgi:hypothetical protein